MSRKQKPVATHGNCATVMQQAPPPKLRGHQTHRANPDASQAKQKHSEPFCKWQVPLWGPVFPRCSHGLQARRMQIRTVAPLLVTFSLWKQNGNSQKHHKLKTVFSVFNHSKGSAPMAPTHDVHCKDCKAWQQRCIENVACHLPSYQEVCMSHWKLPTNGLDVRQKRTCLL